MLLECMAKSPAYTVPPPPQASTTPPRHALARLRRLTLRRRAALHARSCRHQGMLTRGCTRDHAVTQLLLLALHPNLEAEYGVGAAVSGCAGQKVVELLQSLWPQRRRTRSWLPCAASSTSPRAWSTSSGTWRGSAAATGASSRHPHHPAPPSQKRCTSSSNTTPTHELPRFCTASESGSPPSGGIQSISLTSAQVFIFVRGVDATCLHLPAAHSLCGDFKL